MICDGKAFFYSLVTSVIDSTVVNAMPLESIYIFIYIYIYRFQWHGVYDRGINDGGDKRIKKSFTVTNHANQSLSPSNPLLEISSGSRWSLQNLFGTMFKSQDTLISSEVPPGHHFTPWRCWSAD